MRLFPYSRSEIIMNYKIFLVEDEEDLNRLRCSYLANEGWNVQSFANGSLAQAAICEHPHLWILDIMLPGVDGHQLLREIKADDPNMPVIFISARDADIDRIVGLEMGSEDYLTKPFLPRELVIRTRRLLDRAYGSARALQNSTRLIVQPYTIDKVNRRVYCGEKLIDLTSREFDLLLFLTDNIGLPLERQQIIDQVWGLDYFGSDRYAGRCIEICLENGSGTGSLSISNDGPFIDEEQIQSLFEPFSSGNEGQFGLGLSIVREVVSLHHGTIKAENLKNGPRFLIEFPGTLD